MNAFKYSVLSNNFYNMILIFKSIYLLGYSFDICHSNNLRCSPAFSTSHSTGIRDGDPLIIIYSNKWLWQSARPHLLFKIPIGMRNNFSEIYTQFVTNPQKFRQPCPKLKKFKEYQSQGTPSVLPGRGGHSRTWSRDCSKRQRNPCVVTIRLQFEFRQLLVVSADSQLYFMLISVKYNLARRCNMRWEVTHTSWYSHTQGQQTDSTIPSVRQPEQILSGVRVELSKCRGRFPTTLEIVCHTLVVHPPQMKHELRFSRNLNCSVPWDKINRHTLIWKWDKSRQI
jgi:hypothetical protein